MWSRIHEAWGQQLWRAKEALAKLQHHDAVTGTNSESVRNYYIKELEEGDAQVAQIGNMIITDLLRKTSQKDLNFMFCSSQYREKVEPAYASEYNISCPSLLEINIHKVSMLLNAKLYI